MLRLHWRRSRSKLVHTADTDKTKLSCLVRVGGVNRIAHKTKQYLSRPSFQFASVQSQIIILRITERLEIGNWVETRDKTKLSCLACSCVHTADTDKTRQSCLVRVGGVNKLYLLLLRILCSIFGLLSFFLSPFLVPLSHQNLRRLLTSAIKVKLQNKCAEWSQSQFVRNRLVFSTV